MKEKENRLRPDHLIAAILLFTMASIAFVNILSRYLFHFSFAATEELTVNLFVWLTVVGTGIAFERGAQMGMITLYRFFPWALKRRVIIFSALASAALFIIVNIFVLQAVYYELTLFNAASAALGIPVWIYYMGVPFLSIFVFTGIYRDAATKLGALPPEKGGPPWRS